ncbi:MAG: hypothetical protein IT577_13845 [Verrucomicrobiae bacterium]|nr:hypothetical protein [Verrucomicrobiae bacterium]
MAIVGKGNPSRRLIEVSEDRIKVRAQRRSLGLNRRVGLRGVCRLRAIEELKGVPWASSGGRDPGEAKARGRVRPVLPPRGGSEE